MSEVIGQTTRHIEIREYAPQPVLRIRGHIAVALLPRRIPAEIGEVYRELRRRGLAPTGAPYLQCTQPDASGTVDYEVGWPVPGDVTGTGRVEPGVLPGGRAAWTEHRGPYDTLGQTYAAVYAWIAANGHRPSGPPRELYMTGPEVTDPKDIVTEVIAPFA